MQSKDTSLTNSQLDDDDKSNKNIKYLPGQDYMDFEQLKSELENAKQQENLQLQSSIISTILGQQELQKGEKCYYLIKQLNILIKLNSYQDAEDLAKFQSKSCNGEINDLNSFDLLFLAYYGRIQILNEKYIEGIQNIQRARSLINPILKKRLLIDDITIGQLKKTHYEAKMKYPHIENEEQFQKNLLQIEKIYFKQKQLIENLKETANYLWYEDQNGKIKSITDLKNRLIHSVASGYDHILLLVSSCLCHNPFQPKLGCKGIEECNIGSQLYVLGNNEQNQCLGQTYYKQNEKYIKNPYINYYFNGKKISGICAYGNNSCAYDINGNIYEWGQKINEEMDSENKNKEDAQQMNLDKSDNFNELQLKVNIKQTQLNPQIGKIILMKISKNLQAILNDKGQIYIKGTFFFKTNNVLKFDEFTCINREQCFQSIALGDNHLIAICENKKLWGIGDNQKGQINCNFDADQFENLTEQQNILNNFNQFKFIYAYQNLSSLLNNSGDIIIQGEIQEDSQIKKSEQYINENGHNFSRCLIFQKKVYAFNDFGHIFIKDLQSKETLQKIVNDLQDSNFNDAIITENEKFYLRAPFNPEKCTIQLIGDTHRSFSPIRFKLNVYDMMGAYGIKLFYPIRIYCFISDRNNSDNHFVQQLSLEYFKNHPNQYINDKFYCIELSQSPLINMEIKQNEQDLRTYDLEITMDKSDDYYIWVMINEMPIANNPIQFDVKSSLKEKELFKQACDNQAVTLYDQQLQMIKELTRQEDKLNQLEQKELAIQRINDTKLRAQETFNEFQQQRQKDRILENYYSEIKQCHIGGGFDIEKANKIKQIYEKLLDQKLPINQQQFQPSRTLKKQSTYKAKESPYSQTYQKQPSMFEQNFSGVFSQLQNGQKFQRDNNKKLSSVIRRKITDFAYNAKIRLQKKKKTLKAKNQNQTSKSIASDDQNQISFQENAQSEQMHNENESVTQNHLDDVLSYISSDQENLNEDESLQSLSNYLKNCLEQSQKEYKKPNFQKNFKESDEYIENKEWARQKKLELQEQLAQKQQQQSSSQQQQQQSEQNYQKQAFHTNSPTNSCLIDKIDEVEDEDEMPQFAKKKDIKVIKNNSQLDQNQNQNIQENYKNQIESIGSNKKNYGIQDPQVGQNYYEFRINLEQDKKKSTEEVKSDEDLEDIEYFDDKEDKIIIDNLQAKNINNAQYAQQSKIYKKSMFSSNPTIIKKKFLDSDDEECQEQKQQNKQKGAVSSLEHNYPQNIKKLNRAQSNELEKELNKYEQEYFDNIVKERENILIQSQYNNVLNNHTFASENKNYRKSKFISNNIPIQLSEEQEQIIKNSQESHNNSQNQDIQYENKAITQSLNSSDSDQFMTQIQKENQIKGVSNFEQYQENSSQSNSQLSSPKSKLETFSKKNQKQQEKYQIENQQNIGKVNIQKINKIKRNSIHDQQSQNDVNDIGIISENTESDRSDSPLQKNKNALQNSDDPQILSKNKNEFSQDESNIQQNKFINDHQLEKQNDQNIKTQMFNKNSVQNQIQEIEMRAHQEKEHRLIESQIEEENQIQLEQELLKKQQLEEINQIEQARQEEIQYYQKLFEQKIRKKNQRLEQQQRQKIKDNQKMYLSSFEGQKEFLDSLKTKNRIKNYDSNFDFERQRRRLTSHRVFNKLSSTNNAYLINKSGKQLLDQFQSHSQIQSPSINNIIHEQEEQEYDRKKIQKKDQNNNSQLQSNSKTSQNHQTLLLPKIKQNVKNRYNENSQKYLENQSQDNYKEQLNQRNSLPIFKKQASIENLGSIQNSKVINYDKNKDEKKYQYKYYKLNHDYYKVLYSKTFNQNKKNQQQTSIEQNINQIMVQARNLIDNIPFYPIIPQSNKEFSQSFSQQNESPMLVKNQSQLINVRKNIQNLYLSKNKSLLQIKNKIGKQKQPSKYQDMIQENI